MSSNPASLRTDRKSDLIEATITAIASHGLASLTSSKIAEQAGLTAASVNFHFANKDALLLATLRYVSEQFESAMLGALDRAGDDAQAALAAIIEVSLDPALTDPRHLAVWYAFLAEAHSREDYQRIRGERDEAYMRRVHELCARVIEDRRPETAPDARAIAYGLVGVIETLWQEILFADQSYDRDAARDTCRAYLRSVFPGGFEPARVQAPPAREAPVEQDGLRYTLPAWTYCSDELFELEKQQIFMPAWQLVCHESDIPQPGDYVTFEMFNERACVMRGEGGAIHAFHNVCRHRAHAVVDGPAGHCAGYLRCPYHGWTYHLDGSHRSASAPRSFGPFDPGAFGLKCVEHEVFMGLVFIRFAGGQPSVAERFAPVSEEFALYRTAEMRWMIPRADRKFWIEPVAMDWKNGLENYVEDYHFPIGHQGLTALMERDYDREPHPGLARLSHQVRERVGRNWSAQHYARLLPEHTHVPEHMRRRWTYYALYPNTFLDFHVDHMDFFQMLPLGPGRSLLRGRTYALPDERRETRATRYLSRRINMRVQHEDNLLTSSVQRGLASSGYQTGILSDKEVLVGHFQDWVREQLPVTRLAQAPAAGSLRRINSGFDCQTHG